MSTAIPILPKQVTRLDLAFGGRMAELLPDWKTIPEEFKNGRTKWNRLFNDWFYFGLKQLDFTPREGIDKSVAAAHISAIMRSWDPQHEHKEAGCAYLMSLWFEDVQWIRK